MIKNEASKQTVGTVLFRKEEVEQTIPDRFETQVRRVPEQVAVISGGSSLTYEALDLASNRLAHAILDRCGDGVEPIALLFEHDAPAIVAILAVLKAGKIYVPLDPRFPMSRTSFMLDDAEVGLVLTDHQNEPVSRAWTSAERTILDCSALDKDLPTTAPITQISPQTPAVILYSSGSTGQPKGIVHNHRSILHQIWDNTDTYGLDGRERRALVLSYCFAASMSEIFGALMNGSTLCLFDVKTEGLDSLTEWLRRESISVLKLPVSLFRLFLSLLPDHEQKSDLRLVIVGGDTLFRKDVEQFRRHFSIDCRLVNRLASTETNTMAHVVIDHETTFPCEVVPVGYPAADKAVRILDETGTSVAVGNVGEIAVCSRYLAIAYWGQEEMTRIAFQRISQNSEVRMYLTGDLGRLRGDGYLEHLGRKDTQVKIRGFRVELAEVKAALLGLQGVDEAEVVVREDDPGAKHLVAYLIPSSGTTLSVADVRQALVDAVPDYMVPSAYVMLDRLPMTPTGKVDRRALPSPDEARPDRHASPRGPGDEVERALLEIWRDILGLYSIGIGDNFFELGGHSLAALKLVSRIDRRFRSRIRVTALLHAPTVEKMAAFLREQHPTCTGTSLVAFQASGSRAPLYFVPPAGKTVIVFSDLASHFGPAQPFYSFQPLGMDEGQKPLRRVEKMAADYIREIRQVQPDGPYFLGGLCFGGIVAFEMARQLHAQRQEVGMLAILDTISAPELDLSKTPTFSPRYVLSGIVDSALRLRGHCKSGDLGATFIKRLRRKRESLKPPRINLDMSQEPRMTRRIEKVWEAHILARRSYKPEVYEGRITFFLPGSARHGLDQLVGWESLTAEALEIIKVPGMHRSGHAFFRDPHAESLARLLSDCIERNSRA
ncbi:MAG: amino acid adenylation domain-containing protein [Rhodothermia bacterium]